jgi:branched-chain amino acid transport system substrate-binding protein
MGIGADNVIHPEFLIAEDPQPNQKEFVELFKKEYGKLPKHLEATGWDALQAMARGFETAGVDATNEKVCEAMRRPYVGAMTKFDYSAPDMGGLTLSSYTYSKLVKGQFTRLDFKAGGQ